MADQILVNVLSFYGFFLITCGIISTIFIGMKAKTALISGGTSGVIALIIAYLISQQISGAKIAGLIISFALLIVFSWRSTKTLFKLFDLISPAHADLKGKAIAFLIISLMAVTSLFVLALQIIFLI